MLRAVIVPKQTNKKTQDGGHGGRNLEEGRVRLSKASEYRFVSLGSHCMFLSSPGKHWSNSSATQESAALCGNQSRRQWWQEELKAGHFQGFGDKPIWGHNTKNGSRHLPEWAHRLDRPKVMWLYWHSSTHGIHALGLGPEHFYSIQIPNFLYPWSRIYSLLYPKIEKTFSVHLNLVIDDMKLEL